MSEPKPFYLPRQGVRDQESSEDVPEESTDDWQAPDYEVLDEDLHSRTGNFVFTIGNVGCGKSTLQTALVYRLWSREDLLFDFNHESNDQRHDALLQEWILRLYKDGALPERTKAGRLQEFCIAYGQKGKRTLDLNFLEISGEDIKTIVPTIDVATQPTLHRQLEEYLKADKKRINKRFIFVSDATAHLPDAARPEDEKFTEDMLFYALLRYLLGKDGLQMPKIQALFVAAKWDAAQSYFGTVERYCRTKFPRTRAVLNSDRCRTQYIPFSIGKIGEKTVGGMVESRVLALESRYVDLIIQWIYHAFTGEQLRNMRKVKPNLLDRVMRFASGK